MYFCDDIYSLIEKCISDLSYNIINNQSSKVAPEGGEVDIFIPSKIKQPGVMEVNYNEYCFIDRNIEDPYLIDIDKFE